MEYLFVGRDQNNEIIRGKSEAASKEELKSKYLRQKIYLTSIKRDYHLLKKKKIKTKELLRLIEEWQSLEEAKITMQESLAIMQNNATSKRMKNTLQQIIFSINSGSSVIDAFDECSDDFPELFLSIIRIGLARGQMKQTLQMLAEFYKEEAALKGKVSSALIYPKILLVVFLVAFIVVCKFIVPSFYAMFNESNVALNKTTTIVMLSLIYIGNHLLIFGLAIIGLILLFKLLLKSDAIHQRIDYLRLKLFKRYHQIYYSYVFSKTLYLIWRCGYLKNESISLCATVLPNYYLKRSLEDVRSKMEQGTYLGIALEDAHLFDETLCKMLIIGEQGDFMLTNAQNASHYYHLQYQANLDRLVKMIEPSIILVMALLIGFIILVIFIPMLNAFRLVM